ncbi:MAG: bifunctional oligoribonuclease and phosphatase NrnA [Actinomycetota bacterium]|nr:bifunctional oligoribonuclease and phosphatase NrnA [Actinomycetota bacterium]MEA2486941.1 bifunctional oligoribonuclease and phosphatase NrnA [Actinomycetota bacterium]
MSTLDWDGIVNALQGADRIAIACHVNPDGDALGSLLAAHLGLSQLGKKTHPTWSASNVDLPDAYRFLPGGDALCEVDALPTVDTFLALDCGDAERLGDLEKKAISAPTLINIDHHPGNSEFGTLNYVDPSASSTAELVATLLQRLGVKVDLDIATCLYVGVVTDTGRFQYSNSRPETLRLAADLLSYGVDAPGIALEVFESAPFGYLKLLGRVLERATLFENERLVCSWITQADLKEFDVGMDETDKLVDMVRSTRAADVTVMFKEQDDGRWRVSLRSKGPSVGAIARAHGGGGHELAAGFTADDRDAAIADIRAELGAG